MSERKVLNIIPCSEQTFALFADEKDGTAFLESVSYLEVVQYNFGTLLEPLIYDADTAGYVDDANADSYVGMVRSLKEAKQVLSLRHKGKIFEINTDRFDEDQCKNIPYAKPDPNMPKSNHIFCSLDEVLNG